ncbi:MAG: glutamine amidotransferase, partial [Actinomycetes bacterium]
GSDCVSDGVLTTNITATYAHGPVLALNPWLADSVLSSALGTELESLSTLADDLYAHRLGILGY